MLLSKLLSKIEYCGEVRECEVSHITNNSLEAHEGSIFVCIKGFATDGHLFASSAYSRGCRVFVVEKPLDDFYDDAIVIQVKNSRRALALLSCELYENPSHHLMVIGITGTKGKTTSALMLKQLLDASGIKCGYIGSNGVLYGNCKLESTNTTPESYKLQYYMNNMLSSGVRAVVMEVSSQALSQGRVLGIRFSHTLFTNFSPDHIGAGEHANLEEYFLAKKKLFDEYESGLVIANADDGATEKILADCKTKKIFYSIDKPSSYRASDIQLCKSRDILGMSFILNKGGRQVPCSLSIPGEFNIQNALSAIALANSLGLDENFVIQTLSKMKIEGRFETLLTPNGACFVIDYAHNGLSLKSALQALRKYEPHRLICLFGSVGCRTQVRRVQMGKVAAEYADFSILTSDNPNTEDPQRIIDEIATQYNSDLDYISIPDRRDAIEYAFREAKEGDIILLAGKGHEKYQLINGKNEYFCEREILEDCINELKIQKI